MHFNISKRHGYPNIIAIQDSKSILHRSSMMLFSLKSDKMLSCSGCLVLTTDAQQTNKQKNLHKLNVCPNIMNYWMNLSTIAMLGIPPPEQQQLNSSFDKALKSALANLSHNQLHRMPWSTKRCISQVSAAMGCSTWSGRSHEDLSHDQ